MLLSHPAPNITVLDDKDGSILRTINIGGVPEQAMTDGHGKIYVDIEDKDAIAVIDPNAMKMVGKFDVSSKGGGCQDLLSMRRTASSSFVPRQEEHDDSFRCRRAHYQGPAYRQRIR